MIFTQKDFTEARGVVLELLDEDINSLSKKLLELPEKECEDLNNHIKTVCRKMDEFCHLKSFFWTQRILKYWWNPVGKSWGLLQEVVKWERNERAWPKKWEAFEEVGGKCLAEFPFKLPPEKKVTDFQFEQRAKEILNFITTQDQKRKKKKHSTQH